MARVAVVLHDGAPGQQEVRLERILAFFGVPSSSCSVRQLAAGEPGGLPADVVVFGVVEALAAALALPVGNEWLGKVAAIYAYPSIRGEAGEALNVLGLSGWSFAEAPGGAASVRVCGNHRDFTGPMSGVVASVTLAPEDRILVRNAVEPGTEVEPIVTADGAPVFVRFHLDGVPAFVCASALMVDVDEPVARNYYDVKDHFCAAVPLVMFLRSVFAEVMWQPRELGACLIVDDPLLKDRYGFCNFPRMRELMASHGFTTNVAFIPWNWRRTTMAGSRLFREETGRFSVSIHGCDHTAAEFGVTSIESLDRQAKLAQARMRRHRQRTTIEHDPVMVFPQGVFSSQCPGVLKRNGFVAAVNTEVTPIDGENGRTAVRDVWDVAMMRFGSFAIYTRRYAFHGLENFAFDLLLGKPCFIVAHHDFFADGGSKVVGLVEKLSSLDASLAWRSPREVIRRAYRRRTTADGGDHIEMYGNELLIANATDVPMTIHVRKREQDPRHVREVNDGQSVLWGSDAHALVFEVEIPARGERLVTIEYREYPAVGVWRRSLRHELAVTARRLLSEFRDEYVQRMRLQRTAS